jgi:hypothetical protein
VRDHIARVEVQEEQLVVKLAKRTDQAAKRTTNNALLFVPWKKLALKRRREILLPASARQDIRPIRSETRVALVAAIAQGQHWLDELITGAATDVEQIAARGKCTIRQAKMTISLAFLSPTLVKAAIDGRLPRGIGIARLRDAPAEWSRQDAMLSLAC